MFSFRNFVFILAGLSTFHGTSQNLVPNASFEDTIACPTSGGDIIKCMAWFQPNIITSSTDYYHSCAATGGANVPNNSAGFQYAKTGQAYGGIHVYFSGLFNFAREYFEIQLSAPLKNGRAYCVEFWVSLANDFSKYAIDGLGAYFSVDSVTNNNWFVIPLKPQVANPSGSILKDTTNWMQVSGYFTAAGGEQFLTIGNFFSDDSIDILLVNQNASFDFAYYFVDDVSVYQIDTLPTGQAGADITICKGESALIGSDGINANYIYAWQPASGITNTSSYPQSVSPTQTTSYILTVTDTSQKPYKCQPTVTDTVTVEVIECEEVYVPNIFSPNSDGNNDVLFVRGEGITNVELRIYNRLGEKLFETTDINTGWDGTHKGKPVNAGVYVYTGSATFVNGNKQEFKGNVTVVR